jgi:hypothetical protein
MRYVHGGSLVPDISSGLNFLVQSVQNSRAKEEAEQQQQEVGSLVDLASTTTGGEQEAALLRIAQLDPRMAQIMSGVIQRNDQREAQHARSELEKGMKETLLLQQQPDHISKVRMIGSLAEQAAARGESIDKYQNLLNMPEDKLNLELEKRRVMGTDLESLLKQPEVKAPEVKEFKEGDQIVTRQFNPATGQWEQLSTGDRFQSRLLTPEEEAQKARIATAGKSDVNVSVGGDDPVKEVVTPPALLEGLSPDVAAKHDATYKAAGGGKDGLDALNKLSNTLSEQDRRASSRGILKTSFPQADEAEMSQLQAVMDAAKTTEDGLKQAQVLREDQRKTKKANNLKGRAVELLSKIVEHPELNDVLGPLEGGVDLRLFSDGEAELIADIEEVENILTAENLSLMSGVLSESDISILKSIAGGGLNRKRSEERFKSDVGKMINSLSGGNVDQRQQVGRFKVRVK